jgi:hypothetical protein
LAIRLELQERLELPRKTQDSSETIISKSASDGVPHRDDQRQSNEVLQAGMLNKSTKKRKLTRKEQRDLDLEINFMEGIIRRDPSYADAWRVLSENYSRRGRFQDGLVADVTLASIQPEDPEVLYNLACSYSLVKDPVNAVESLTRAIGNGFNNFKWLLKDPDLANLRKNPMFRKIWVRISAVQPGVR